MLPIVPDSGKAKITNKNIEFLQHLTGEEAVGVDKKGRLYTVSGLRSVGLRLGRVFKSSQEIDQVVNDSLKSYLAQKNTEWQQNVTDVQTIRTFYNGLISKLSRASILSNSNKDLLLRDKYDQIYQALLSSGKSPFVAECMTTIEMSQDPLVPDGIKNRIKPELTRSGVNGTYIIKNRSGENLGVFKPSDEEVNMPNNPRIPPGTTETYDKAHPKRLGPYEGHVQGTGWTKEIAAYTIGKEMGFVGVPPTVKLSVQFPERTGSTRLVAKEGSLQRFVRGEALEKRKYEDVMELPAKEIHKIVLFDLLIGNADRNLGNCFIDGSGSKSSLTPIDHGFSLLDSVVASKAPKTETNCHLATLPQVREPCDFELIASVIALTPDVVDTLVADLRRKEAPLTENSLKEFKIRLMIMQVALKEGCTVAQLVPMLMFMGTSALIETLTKSGDAEKFLEQWEIAEGDLSRLSSTLGKAIEQWVQTNEEQQKTIEYES